MARHEFDGPEKYESTHEFLYGAGDIDEVPTKPTVGKTYALKYISSHSDTIQTVVGQLHDHDKMKARLITGDGDKYEVMGTGLADREEGEVLKNRRRVGYFDMAHEADDH